VENQKIRTLKHTDDFDEFYNSLSGKAAEKLDEGLSYLKIVYVLSTKFVKKLEGTELYELRTSVGYNEYRTILFAIDHGNIIQAKNIILLNGFLKKDAKEYRKHIKKAINILNTLTI
jgi:hypothetical protein